MGGRPGALPGCICEAIGGSVRCAGEELPLEGPAVAFEARPVAVELALQRGVAKPAPEMAVVSDWPIVTGQDCGTTAGAALAQKELRGKAARLGFGLECGAMPAATCRRFGGRSAQPVVANGPL